MIEKEWKNKLVWIKNGDTFKKLKAKVIIQQVKSIAHNIFYLKFEHEHKTKLSRCWFLEVKEPNIK
jgi:hypothetical protein